MYELIVKSITFGCEFVNDCLMAQKIEVVICLGSSCFARGNKNTLRVITQFIKQHSLEDRIHFHGGHCFGNCAEGPILKVGDTLYTGVDDTRALEILSNTFNI
ncbi:MAG TPA: NAD(P)H-dependent oxidoreductase subunit E [Tenuifilaceae bacterium]|nr:NAD(P)H-dependent oxidoreductase subunit E [Tenuifilaceae bacterium]HPE17709.1 NAD(P)H-dependent oxidoreductase subunit E [Tenuifilaceae bacterium]HPJ45184.1 NAD(P)H-dependent oxidoreductase subunit E [Tenuifilaceae bacterium]HPQ33413.1 NAD(P)H-dependent oxidoreductase subunit E [Tenuifilaceae bacterium]HRX66947.1 NAD(P)H-dependent oxidoreductase subunit E [Tenuifilaceae bacterium]